MTRHVVIWTVTTIPAIVTVHLGVQTTGKATERATGYVILQSVPKMEAIVWGIAHKGVNPGGQGITGVTMYVTLKPVTTMKAIVRVPRDVKTVGQGMESVTGYVM